MRELINHDTMMRTIRRITHEIIERNESVEDLIIFGIKNKGVPLARSIQENILHFEQIEIPLFELDITPYRDDMNIPLKSKPKVDVTNKTVIVVDDVLYTGRTVRAALDAVIDLGRPKKIQLAVLIDRGHRELPVRADYVGKNIPTSSKETIRVSLDDKPGVFILQKGEMK